MLRRIAVSAVILVAACAQPSGTIPSGERGGRAEVVAGFAYVVRQELIRGSYDPKIFEKDRVLGHVRRSCEQFSIAGYRETRSAGRVSFTAGCRRKVNSAAIGRWVVERGVGGNERARKL